MKVKRPRRYKPKSPARTDVEVAAISICLCVYGADCACDAGAARTVCDNMMRAARAAKSAFEQEGNLHG